MLPLAPSSPLLLRSRSLPFSPFPLPPGLIHQLRLGKYFLIPGQFHISTIPSAETSQPRQEPPHTGRPRHSAAGRKGRAVWPGELQERRFHRWGEVPRDVSSSGLNRSDSGVPTPKLIPLLPRKETSLKTSPTRRTRASVMTVREALCRTIE